MKNVEREMIVVPLAAQEELFYPRRLIMVSANLCDCCSLKKDRLEWIFLGHTCGWRICDQCCETGKAKRRVKHFFNSTKSFPLSPLVCETLHFYRERTNQITPCKVRFFDASFIVSPKTSEEIMTVSVLFDEETQHRQTSLTNLLRHSEGLYDCIKSSTNLLNGGKRLRVTFTYDDFDERTREVLEKCMRDAKDASFPIKL